VELNTRHIATPIGTIQAYASNKGLSRLLLPGDERLTKERPGTCAATVVIPYFQELAKQLNQYFLGQRREFTLPLALRGTPFQRQVWSLLQGVLYGTTDSYGHLAEHLGNRNKARAVGQAIHANPLPILIPCHRVIGSRGKLTGFAAGLALKKQLLELEQRKHR